MWLLGNGTGSENCFVDARMFVLEALDSFPGTKMLTINLARGVVVLAKSMQEAGRSGETTLQPGKQARTKVSLVTTIVSSCHLGLLISLLWLFPL